MRSRARLSSHPIHPMLVSLPIGLWIGGFIFDSIGVLTDRNEAWNAGFYAIVGGCIGAVLAAIPGLIDLLFAIPPNSTAKKRGFLHAGLNVLALLIFAFVAWRRQGPWTMPEQDMLFLEFLGLIGIGVSGWLGGTLVYRNQIGVDRRYANAGKLKERSVESFERPVCSQGELGMGQTMLVHIGRERVTIARCEEGFFAFADHCTHRGGPLSDGAIVGCTVQCPWHGSQFDIRTGRIVAGPAERPIVSYEVEVRADEVYVRPRTLQPERKAA